MKIALTVDSKTFGGIEAHIMELANELLKRGAEVTVIRLNDYARTHPFTKKCADLHIPYVELNGNLKKIFSYFSRNHFSVIHSHGYKANIFNKMFGIFASYKAVCTFHSGDQGQGKLFLYDACDRYTAWLADHNIAVSKTIQSSLLGTSQLLHNAVSTHNVPLTFGQKIGFVGRLSKEKGPDRFIAISRHFPEQQFVLFGDGPEMPHLRQNLPQNVTLAGHQTDMAKVWPQISILLMPSRAEGLPLACLEAMVRGIPTLTSALGSLPEVIEHKKNGYLLPKFSVRDCVATLDEWINLPETQKNSMRKLARMQITDYFSIEQYAVHIEDIYKHVVKKDVQMLKDERNV